MSGVAELNFSGRRRLPIIIAAEAAECGLCCLAMIGGYYGHDVDLGGLRQRFSLSINGVTLRSLMDISDRLGFSARALRAELSHVDHIRLPAILHWDLNHFVVLRDFSSRRATIHDPSRGVRTLSIEEFSRHFTGVALELAPAASFNPITARQPVRLSSLWSNATGLWGAAAQILALSAALQIAAFAAPFQIQLIVDEAIGRSDATLLATLAIGFGALAILQNTIEALRAWALQVFGNLLTFQIVGNIVRHLLRLPVEFFEKRNVGDILSRINSTSTVQDAVTRGVVSALLDGVMALAAIVILFFYSATLASIVLLAVAINAAIAFGFYPANRRLLEEQLVAGARERSHLMESIRAAVTIKLLGGESIRESAWRNLYASAINASTRLGKLQIKQNYLQTTVTVLSTVIVVYMSSATIIAGRGFSVGMLLAFLSFRQTFADRMSSLIAQGMQFRLLGLHLDRMGDIVTAQSDSGTTSESQIRARGAITLRNVSFSYSPMDRKILQDVNIEIAPGDFVAISGPSGGGKTTLLKLMLGLYPPTDGQVLLDGQPATPASWRVWRQRVGIVAQDDRLLSGSIADNISFFDPDPDMARVHSAAKAARVYDDIMKMPMQFLSLVGDMGSSLSGGQRQRVLLARALYREPEVLVLDEGTANLDEQTEKQIADLVASLPITRIVVAHRPALLRRSIRQFVVEDGRLIECGAT